MTEYIYKVKNRKTGKTVASDRGTGPLQQIYWNADRWRGWKHARYDIIQYELIERRTLPITDNADFDKMMFHSFGDEQYKG